MEISNLEVPVVQIFKKNDFGRSKSAPPSVRFSEVFSKFSDDFRIIFGYSRGVLEVFGGVPDVFGGFPRFLG